MSTPCIISVAITGSLPKKKDNPAVPITVAEQVESTQAAFEAGASLVHLHVRNDDGTPSSAPERFFFEIVHRKGYDAYGALNAPARMASQEQADAR